MPQKFLELILVDLKTTRFVESLRGAKGGYRLRRAPSRLYLDAIILTMDGPLALFGDAELLRKLVKQDRRPFAFYRLFLDLRNTAARILDHHSIRILD